MKQTITSWALLLVCNMIWALQFTCIKLTQGQIGPYFTVWGPMLLSTVFLAPFAFRDFRKDGRSLKDLLVFVQLAVLGVFPAQVLMTWGTQYSLASNAAILSLTLPVITMMFAYMLLGEKMNRVRWISLFIALAGVIVCSVGDIRQMDFGSAYTVGNVLIFLAIMGNAYYNVGIKMVAAKYTGMEMLFYSYVCLDILLLPLVSYYEPDIFGRIPDFTRQTWIGISLLTFFHNFLSMLLFFYALKILDAMQVAVSNYLIPFLGLLAAGIWLKEEPSGQVIAGGVLVLASTLIITVVDFKMSNNRSNLIKQ